MIEGPPGVGKTTLLAAAGTLAAVAGLAALVAGAGPLETDLAWNVVRQLFASVIQAGEGDQAELLSGAAALASTPLGLRERHGGSGGLHGLYWLTARLARRSPLLIAVDDAQWADEPSLRYLDYLAQRIGDLPILAVLATRSGAEDCEPLREIAANPSTDVMTLRELSPAASASLTRAEFGPGAADGFCAACFEATNGNPFLLSELIDQLRREDVEPGGAGAVAIAGLMPDAIVRSVLLRLSRLPDDARELASAIAILGADAGLAEAAALAGLPADRAAQGADALVSAAILAPAPSLSFAHPIVHGAVYRQLPAHSRARGHREAAGILAAAGAGSDRVATQLLASEPAGDAWVVQCLRDAASAAMRAAAPGSAAELLERAIREPPPEADRAEILVELGRAQLASGRGDPAARFEQAIALHAEPRDRAEVMLELGRALYVGGRPEAAAGALERGIAELQSGGADAAPLVAELQAAWLSVARTEPALRGRASALAHEIAERPPRGETHGERALLSQVAGELTFDAVPRERPLELARLALADGKLIQEETSDGIAMWAALGALGWGDDFDGYEAAHAALIADARRRGSVVGFAAASYGLSFSHYYRGRLAEAIADAEQALAIERHGWAQFLTAARAQLAWALIDCGDLAGAAATLDGAERNESSEQGLVLEARARLELARGDPRAALAAALAAGRVFEAGLITNPSIAPWRSRAAVAAAQLGDTARAEEFLVDALALARRYGAPRPIGVALSAVGQVRSGTAGLEALEEAVEVLAGSPARIEHARALILYGAALRRQRRIKPAREPLLNGLDLAAGCGAGALEERARAELVAAGARPRRPRLSGVESLTPAELRVAELAAGGTANREIAESLFVSLRTVETHLTHVYRKLGIRSRAELSEALAAKGGRFR